jgi:hypothetical protein
MITSLRQKPLNSLRQKRSSQSSEMVKEIPYDQGGPIRIIFGSKSTWAKYLDAWNWSLSSITVK